jgi:hypothetical protein
MLTSKRSQCNDLNNNYFDSHWIHLRPKGDETRLATTEDLSSDRRLHLQTLYFRNTKKKPPTIIPRKGRPFRVNPPD